MELRRHRGLMDNKSGNDLGKSRPWRFLRNVMRLGHGWQRTVSPSAALCARGTVQTIGHKKIRLPAPCRACSKIGSVFSTFTMISAYFSISQIEKTYEIRGITRYFTNISPTSYVRGSGLNRCTCNFARQSSSELPSLPAPARAVGMVWKSQAIRPQLHVDF